MERPASIDLFCGAGGMTLGFEQAGFDVLAAYDLEEFNIATHRANFPDTRAFAADLSTSSGDALRKLAALHRTEIDVVFGGPPCQGFSFGGRQDVDDDRNLLVYDFARLVRELNPKYFVMENVRGLMSSRAKPILESFVRRLKRAGYLVVEPIRVLNAADYGVPQRRLRTFVLGYRNGLVAPKYPDPRGIILRSGSRYKPVVRDAISDLPVLERFEHLFEQDAFDEPLLKTDNAYAALMRGTMKDPRDHARKRKHRTSLTGCLRTRHSKATVRRFSSTPQGAAESISRYIRLALNEVAPTIRAGTGTDRGSHTAPRPIHPKVPRCISAREAARLHSLPDWFQLHGTRWHAFRQIGNSVPPLLASEVARAVFAVC